ncbi:MAG TPA: nucleoside 2-deoxyribosyltransferase [Candidatus Binatia bacterium]|nr:nucleoside 2-deoxyribosyltransferase [Candidatus Binatia bacterium]
MYLSGPINGCSDPECRDWRNQAVECLIKIGFEVIDPMARDYRGDEDKNVESIVKGDLQDIEQADILLVNAERPSWGTAMEVFLCFPYKESCSLDRSLWNSGESMAQLPF